MSYESHFGTVWFDDGDVPDKYRPKPGSMDRTLEQVHSVGGQPDGRAYLIYQPDHGDGGPQIGWIVSLVVPFTGEFHHEVAREPLGEPGMPDHKSPLMA